MIGIIAIAIVCLFLLFGVVSFRALRRKAALGSGEIVEMRDALPEGDVDAEFRVLGDRLYRVDLAFEARTRSRGGREGSAPSENAPECVFPYQLSIVEIDGEVLFQKEGFLQDLFGLASMNQEPRGDASGLEPFTSHWGNLPLLEFDSDSIRRLRFELSIPTGEGGLRSTPDYDAHLDKASLVIKEDVSALSGAGGRVERVRFDSTER